MRSLLCLSLALGALNLAACKTENPSFCCTVTEACLWPGGTDGTFVECTDPAKPYCDNYGYYGPERACVADPIPGDGGPPDASPDSADASGDAASQDAGVDAPPDCTSSAECTVPTEPICVPPGTCAACESGVTGDADCAAKDPAAPRCVADGSCVECLTSSECDVATAPICAPSGDCAACQFGAGGDADCAAKDTTAPRCAVDGTCVECLTGSDCASATAPICDAASQTCRSCQAHSECSSEVCNETSGACVVAGNIIYVATTGTDGATCGTSASPCFTLGGAQGALAKVTVTRKWIKVRPGSYSENVNINDVTANIIAAGAALAGVAGNDPVIDVLGNSTISIEGLRIHDGLGGGGDGLRCNIDVDSPEVTLLEVSIDTNGGQGIDATSCSIAVERSRVIANAGGGINLASSNFALRNNFIVKNGGIASSAGGIGIVNNPPGGSSAARLEFNTLSGNLAQAGNPSGVLCLSISTPLTFSNNIVHSNLGVDGQVGGDTDCAWRYSDIEGGQSGTGNINAAPLFVNPTADDYHIQSGSPCRDAADPAATLAVDIDGQVRPQGARHDMGADEYTP